MELTIVRLRRIAGVLVAVMMVAGCNRAEPDRGHSIANAARLQCAVVASENDTTCPMFAPSLIELIARPELYDGKRVRVAGFADLEFEGNSLYLSREDYVQMLTRNGVWLDASDSLA